MWGVDRCYKGGSGQGVGRRVDREGCWLILGYDLRLALVGAVGGGELEVGFV